MEFRRIEITRSLKHKEPIDNILEIRSILEKLRDKNLKFSIRSSRLGTMMKDCSVMSIGEKSVIIFSSNPVKVQFALEFPEIEILEVESNCNFLAESPDSGGRWARIL